MFICNSKIIEDFEKCEDVLITQYNLQETPWLHSLYSERKFWVSVFLKDVFYVEMNTTQ